MDSRDISIIIPTYNQLGLLKRLLSSLERQSDPGSFEVIVVDDGSSDDTREFISNYRNGLDLKTVINQSNLGRSVTRNRGVEHAERQIILFLDGDVECPPNLVAGHAKYHDGSNLVVLGRVIYDRKAGCRGWTRYLENRGPVKLKPGVLVPGRYFLSGHSSLPKILFQSIKGFCEEIEYYGEDIDLGIRMEEIGARFVFAPELIVTHNHIRELKEVLELSKRYGQLTLPELVKRHPRLLSDLRLDIYDRPGLKSNLYRMMLKQPLYRMISRVTGVLNNWWAPPIFYSYLLFYNYLKGYKTGISNHGSFT